MGFVRLALNEKRTPKCNATVLTSAFATFLFAISAAAVAAPVVSTGNYDGFAAAVPASTSVSALPQVQIKADVNAPTGNYDGFAAAVPASTSVSALPRVQIKADMNAPIGNYDGFSIVTQ